MGGVTKALLAGSFVFGIAFGAWLNGEANFQPNNVASTEIVDRKTPSGAVCMANGYSSMVRSHFLKERSAASALFTSI